jgi:putative tryptophan/tyrosine transport system substrate-binding protein
MKRREFISLVGGASASLPLVAWAQSSNATRVVGVFMPGPEADPEGQSYADLLRQGLRDYGWTIDGNLRIHFRWGVASAERTQAAISELLALKPDVVLTGTSGTLTALQRATQTVPIVFFMIYEPVAQGFVQSLAHPGGNATGFTGAEATVGAKWLGLLKQMAPSLARVAFISNPDNPGPMQSYRSFEAAAANIAVEATNEPVRGPSEIEAVMVRLREKSGGGLIVPPDGFLLQHSRLIIDLAARYRLPAIYGVRSFAADGGLACYGVSVGKQFQSAAGYINRILRGEKAGDLPVQQPNEYEFIINGKTARALGLVIPPTLLATADEVIE